MWRLFAPYMTDTAAVLQSSFLQAVTLSDPPPSRCCSGLKRGRNTGRRRWLITASATFANQKGSAP